MLADPITQSLAMHRAVVIGESALASTLGNSLADVNRLFEQTLSVFLCDWRIQGRLPSVINDIDASPAQIIGLGHGPRNLIQDRPHDAFRKVLFLKRVVWFVVAQRVLAGIIQFFGDYLPFLSPTVLRWLHLY